MIDLKRLSGLILFGYFLLQPLLWKTCSRIQIIRNGLLISYLKLFIASLCLCLLVPMLLVSLEMSFLTRTIHHCIMSFEMAVISFLRCQFACLRKSNSCTVFLRHRLFFPPAISTTPPLSKNLFSVTIPQQVKHRLLEEVY